MWKRLLPICVRLRLKSYQDGVVTTFRWHMLDASLRLSENPKVTSEDLILVMGLSENVCLPLEVWSDGQGAAIVGILPLPVAVLAWCNAVLPTEKKHSISPGRR